MCGSLIQRDYSKFEDGRFVNRPYKVSNRELPNGVTITARVCHALSEGTALTEIGSASSNNRLPNWQAVSC